MRSNLAALRTLVLPYGATGRRIVLDGINGAIEVYDAAGLLRIELGGVGADDRIVLHTGDAAENAGALFRTGVLGAGAARRLDNIIDSPSFAGRSFPTLMLASESFDGTVATKMQYVAARHEFIDAGDGGPDITLAGVSLPRGVVAYQVLTASDVARAAGVNTDMALTFTADVTRLYQVFFKSQWNFGGGAGIYAVDLSEGGTVGANDGTAVDRLLRVNAAETGAATISRTASVLYRPAAGSTTIRVRNSAGSAGTITLAADGTANVGTRAFWIEDIGAR